MQRLYFLLLVLLLPSLSQATTYYAATSGGGSCSTNTNAPQQGMNAGIGCLSAGDTLLVRAGVYAETFYQVVPNGVTLRSEVQYGAILRPPQASQYSFIFALGPSASNITIDGFVLDGVNQTQPINHIWIMDGSHDITIKNCDIKNGIDDGSSSSSQGISTDHNVNTVTISRTKIHDIGGLGAGNATGAYAFYWHADNSLFEGNEVYNISGYSIHMYNPGAGEISSNNIFRNNIFHDNGDGVLLGSGGNNNLFYNNILYRNGFLGGSPAGHGHAALQVAGYGGQDSIGNKLMNNTFYGNAYGAINLGVNSPATNTVVQNNILLQNGSDVIGRQNDINTTADHNFCQGVGCSVYTSNFGAVFVNAPGGDFHLQSNSPAIDAGLNLQTIFSTDISGAARGTGSGWDVGAYEFGDSLVPPPTRLRFTVQPQNTPAGQIMAAVVVQAQPLFSATVTAETVLVSGCPQ
jgi:parallel beta-helix repeat protein